MISTDHDDDDWCLLLLRVDFLHAVCVPTYHSREMQPQALDPTAYGFEPVPPVVWGPGVSASADFSRWSVVYPHYLDAQLPRIRGRRVARAHAVDAPATKEVAAACEALGLPHVVEDKCYPRDALVRGRVRISGVGPKNRLLPSLTEAIRENRAAQPQQPEPSAPSKPKKKK
eukprot:Polyplicarium_translucidae@DN2527_c0_g1_i4.p5